MGVQLAPLPSSGPLSFAQILFLHQQLCCSNLPLWIMGFAEKGIDDWHISAHRWQNQCRSRPVDSDDRHSAYHRCSSIFWPRPEQDRSTGRRHQSSWNFKHSRANSDRPRECTSMGWWQSFARTCDACNKHQHLYVLLQKPVASLAQVSGCLGVKPLPDDVCRRCCLYERVCGGDGWFASCLFFEYHYRSGSWKISIFLW